MENEESRSKELVEAYRRSMEEGDRDSAIRNLQAVYRYYLLDAEDRTLQCPRCRSEEYSRYGRTSSGTQRYKCKGCGKVYCFSGTRAVIAHTKLPVEKWMDFAECFVDDLSPRETQRKIGVTQETAWFMGDRTKTLLSLSIPIPMTLMSECLRYDTGTEALMALVTSVDRIAWTLLSKNSTNTFLSPLGFAIIFEELSAGGSPSGPFLREYLGLECSPMGSVVEEVSDTFGTYWKDSFDCVNLALLNTANNICFHEEFVDCLGKKFFSEVIRRDFSENLPATMKEVRDRVSESTHGRCKDYSPSISVHTVCALYNILYLKERWGAKFHYTDRADFRMSGGRTKKVQMMHGEFYLRYTSDQKYRGIFLPLSGGSDAGGMLVIIPADKGTDMLSRWSSEPEDYKNAFVRSVLAANHNHMAVSLPKFEMETDLKLDTVLRDLGIFEEFAKEGFDGIIVDDNAVVIDGGQKAGIKVTEQGLEAYAVTEACLGHTCAPMLIEPVPFVCDMPFVFLICDRGSGLPLFAGQVAEPISKRSRKDGPEGSRRRIIPIPDWHYRSR